MSVAYTGQCKECGHVESSHKKLLQRLCNIKKCTCTGFVNTIDIEAHNSVDGRPAMELYKFQTDYLRGMPAKYIMAADTGTGKTVMSLAHYDAKAYLTPLLILAPASKVNTGDWERELRQYFAGRLLPEFEIYSYEKFSRVPTIPQYRKTGATGVWKDYIKRHPQGFAVICDEIHKAKNPQSGIGKRVFEVSQLASFFIGLSATPLPNGWIDCANYLKMFGLVKNISAFRQRYCEIQTFKGFPEIVGYKNESELSKIWNDIARPLRKEDALDLPPITVAPVSLDSTPEYTKVKRTREWDGKFLDNPSAIAHALRQSITGPKLAWLDNFLDGVSDNVVIFYNYRSEREAILELIKRNHKNRRVFRQDGEKHEIPGKDQWAGLSRTITLAQYQSGSTGIELTYAATTVYFSPTYSYSNYEQSIGRTNRNGQTQKLTLYLLASPMTIEMEIWAALREKRDFQENQWYNDNMTN